MNLLFTLCFAHTSFSLSGDTALTWKTNEELFKSTMLTSFPPPVPFVLTKAFLTLLFFFLLLLFIFGPFKHSFFASLYMHCLFGRRKNRMERGRRGLRLVRLSKKEATIICIEYKRDSCGWRGEENTRFYKIGVLLVTRESWKHTWPQGVTSKKAGKSFNSS